MSKKHRKSIAAFELSEALTSVTREITCHNSGVLLGHIQVCIVEGHMTYLQSLNDNIFVHPFYGLDPVVLMSKLQSSIEQHKEAGWSPPDSERTRLCLLCSAIMHAMGVIKQFEPSLPSHQIACASAGRLLGIAKWYFFISSQRLQFPVYSVSDRNENTNWENFKFWLDSAYQIRHDWATQKREWQKEAEKKAFEEAMLDIRRESMKAVDKRKVWGWIQTQLVDKEPPGRIETWKDLFLNGDTDITSWLGDDVDDLQFAIARHADVGHEIMFYITKRLNGIRSLIKDFYSSFTLITRKQKDQYGNDEQTAQEKEFFAGFDATAAALEVLPSEPDRKDFTTLGLFMQAKARWNILKKRWDELQKSKQTAQQVPTSIPANAASLDAGSATSEGVEL